MFRTLPYFAVVVVVLSIATWQPGKKAGQVAAGHNWSEECQTDGPCSTEELSEIWEDYSEECMQDTCTGEEVAELAGGTPFVNSMLSSFLGSGRVILSSSFDGNTAPPPGAVWWYTGCGYTGNVAQTNASQKTMPVLPTSRNSSPASVNFNTSTLGYQIGSGVSTVEVFNQPFFVGACLSTSTSVECLASPTSTCGNDVQSEQQTNSAASRKKP